jgi:hypothetical protein
MRKFHVVVLIAFCFCVGPYAYAQGDVQGTATGICVLPTYAGGDGRPHPCSSFSAPATSTGGVNPTAAAAANAIGEAGDALIYKLLFGGNNQNNAATAAQQAAAKAAEQQRIQQEMERQRVLAEQRRQRIFGRVNSMLAASGMGTLSAPGIQMSDVQSMMGSDKPGISLDDIKSASGAGFDTPAKSVPPPTDDTNVVDLRDCGGPSAPCPTPMGDFGVVDLASVQQGVDLAVVAAGAPAADRQTILDQALAAANGDKTIQVNLASDAPAPVVTQQGLLAFQKANAEYRKAQDAQYQFEKAFQNRMKECAAGHAFLDNILKTDLINDLQNHEDEMTLARQQEALSKIFQAGLDQDVACGDENARIALALQNTDWARFEAESVLAKIAHVRPPSAPAVQPTTDADLKLLLPDQPTAEPTEADMDLVENGIVSEAVKIPAEVVKNYPPAVAVKYKTDPSFAAQMNQMHAGIFANLQKDYRAAAREADYAYQKELAGMIQKGIAKPDVPLDQQEAANPQLRLQLQTIRQQITTRLDYECSLARTRAEMDWQGWVEEQDARLTGKPEPDQTYLLLP